MDKSIALVVELPREGDLYSLYQNFYKPIFKFLYTCAEIKLTMRLGGEFLRYIHKKYPESVDIIEELSKACRLEITGGGFYDPFFPLLSQADRVRQLELLSEEIRKCGKRRPRGVALSYSVWDPSLIQTFAKAAYDYVLLSENIIKNGHKTKALIASERDKSLFIVPFTSSNENIKIEKSGVFSFSISSIKSLIDEGRLSSLVDEGFSFQTVFEYLNEEKFKESVYIPPSADFSSINREEKTVYALLEKNTQAKVLYDRSLFVSRMISHYRGDKIRKKIFLERLLQTQSSKYFFTLRSEAFKILASLESSLRNTKSMETDICTYDYNRDSLEEFVLTGENYTAVIHLRGAKIYDFQSLYSKLSITEPEEGLFFESISSLFAHNEDEKREIDLSSFIFNISSFLPKKKCAQFSAHLTKKDLNLLITKKYTMTPSGLTVQYILNNKGDERLSLEFCVKSVLSLADERYEREAVSREKKFSLQGELKDIEALRFTGNKSHDIFIYELNEKAQVIFNENTERLKFAVVWNLEIESGKSVEKNIGFSVTH